MTNPTDHPHHEPSPRAELTRYQCALLYLLYMSTIAFLHKLGVIEWLLGVLDPDPVSVAPDEQRGVDL